VASEAGGEEPRSIGARLRAARETKGLTILQAAERLHVDPRVLEALEAQNFEVLGAEVYVRGHLRRYAESLGESAAQLQELYSAGPRAARPDLTRIPRAAPRGDSPRLMLPALLVVVGFGVAGLLWWVLGLQSQKAQPVLPATPAAGTTALAAAPGLPETESPAHAGAAPGDASGVPAAARAAAAAPGGTQLALSFSAASWVEVSDANGRRLLQGLIDGGSERTLAGAAPLRVILGNAPGVALQVNGRAVELAGLVRRDGSARLLIDGAGRASAAPPRLAHGD
jgi:cytoskeleton protein RodZ